MNVTGLKSYVNSNLKQLNIFNNLVGGNGDSDGTSWDAILVAGLNGNGFKPTAEQVEIFKLGFGASKKIRAFDYYFSEPNKTKIKQFIDILETVPPIFLFSAGCRYAEFVANISKVDKNKIYIIEPTLGGETEDNIREAINKKPIGVPTKNIFFKPGLNSGIVGTQSSEGVAKNKTNNNPTLSTSIFYTYNGVTKYEWSGHWDALRAVSLKFKNI